MPAPDGYDPGPTVSPEGELLRGSVSSIQTHDPEQGGCNRKFAFDKVFGQREEEKSFQELGKQVHSELEQTTITGINHLGPIARLAVDWVYKPSPLIIAEYHVKSTERVFTIDGLPIEGYIDIVNLSGRFATTMRTIQDEPYPEVLDWKTTSNLAYAKTGEQLVKTVQMPMYGLHIVNKFAPNASHVRLSHVTMQTKSPRDAIKSTILVPVETLYKREERVIEEIRLMRVTARAKTIEDVAPNTKACSSYGGCDYRSICPRSAEQRLIDMFGSGSVIVSRNRGAEAPQKDAPAMSLSSLIPGNDDDAPAAPATAKKSPAQLLREQLAEAEANEALEVEKAARALKASQNAAAEKSAAASAPKSPDLSGFTMRPTVPDGSFALDPREVGAHQALPGAVALVGAAARAFAGVSGVPFAEEIVTTVEKLVEAGFGIASAPEKATIKAVRPFFSITPPDMPASKPELAADPVLQEQIAALPTAVQKAAQEQLDAVTAAAASAPAGPQKRGATKAPPAAPAVAAKPAEGLSTSPSKPAPAAPAEPEEKPVGLRSSSKPEIVVFVDCVAEKLPGAWSGMQEDLRSYVKGFTDQLCNTYKCVDVRCAPKDSPLAFGGWEGALTGLIEATPPAPGVYVLNHVKGDRLWSVVADALRNVATTYVRGY